MPSVTFSMMTGETKQCIIPCDVGTVLTYITVESAAYHELGVSPEEYRLRLFYDDEEDCLTAFSQIRPDTLIRVLPLRLSTRHTTEMYSFLDMNSNVERPPTYEYVNGLLNDGADIAALSIPGRNVIYYILSNYSTRFLKLLISHGFDVNCKSVGKCLLEGLWANDHYTGKEKQHLLLSAGLNTYDIFCLDNTELTVFNLSLVSSNKLRLKRLCNYSVFVDVYLSSGRLQCNKTYIGCSNPLFYYLNVDNKIKYNDQFRNDQFRNDQINNDPVGV